MSKFRNTENEVVVSVADEKDERFGNPLWEKVAEKPAAKKPATK